MKKELCCLLSYVMLMTFTACGNGSDDQKDVDWNTSLEAGLYRDGELIQGWDDLIAGLGYASLDASGVIEEHEDEWGYTYSYFEKCNGDLVLPDNIIGIDEYAFDGCYGLTSITIPASVTYIDDEAMDEAICRGNLRTIIVEKDSYAEEWIEGILEEYLEDGFDLQIYTADEYSVAASQDSSDNFQKKHLNNKGLGGVF